MAIYRLTYGNKKILVFKDIEEISDFIIRKWKDISREAIKERNKFVVVVSGGKTPIPIYQKLASSKNVLPWNRVHIFLSDERFVSFDSLESNFRLIKNNLLNNVDIPEANIHPIYTEETAQISAKKYEEDIRKFFNLKEHELPKFDLIMLGIGQDGHTASLFPDTNALYEEEHLATAVNFDKLSYERISLTLPVINNANNIIFLATGENKAKIIKEILEGDNSHLPVALVRIINRDIFFLLDTESGSLLLRPRKPFIPALKSGAFWRRSK